MSFFIWRKDVLFSRYLDFRVFVKFTNFKVCDVITDIAAWWKLHFCLFLWILSTIKRKFGQIIVYLTINKNIYNMFLAQCWRLETSSRPFYDFNEMTIQRDLSIFGTWYLAPLILPHSPFQKKWNTGNLT